jgi:flavin-dependent dehydrogenase
METFFRDTVAMSPELSERLQDAELVGNEVHATGNYAYTSERCCGERYLMLGDAYAFIDPVFSSGVYLAMKSAFASVEVIEATLDQPRQAAAARRRFQKLMDFGPREFSWFIFRVTNPTLRDFFMYPSNPFRVREALLSMLAGDIYGKTPIWGSLRVLKGLYYLVSLQNLGRTWRAWRQRKINIREVGAPLA